MNNLLVFLYFILKYSYKRKNYGMKLSNKLSRLFLIPTLLLVSCGKQEYPLSDYRLTLPFRDGFRILQWTDIHLGDQSNTYEIIDTIKAEYEYVTKTDKVDLIVFTGDIFMNATKGQIHTFLEFVETLTIGQGSTTKVPFAFTYGNHDIQGNYDIDFIAKEISECENAVFMDHADDNIYGLTNYCIDLIDKQNNPIYRLYILDSNAYVQVGMEIAYDCIHDDQLDHMKKLHDTYGDVPALAFYHIPVYEFEDAYEAVADKDQLEGVNEEPVSHPYERTNAFERMKNECHVEGMFVGHDHVNNTTIDYQDVILSYGTKTTYEVYGEPTGITTITLDLDQTFGLDNVHKEFFIEGAKPYEQK